VHGAIVYNCWMRVMKSKGVERISVGVRRARTSLHKEEMISIRALDRSLWYFVRSGSVGDARGWRQ